MRKFLFIDLQVLDWDEKVKKIVLSSFFWGYLITQIPGGMLSQRWGAHKLFAYAVGLCGLASLAIPAAASTNRYEIVCLCRAFCGLCQGVVSPVLHTLLSKWVPLPERGTFSKFFLTTKFFI